MRRWFVRHAPAPWGEIEIGSPPRDHEHEKVILLPSVPGDKYHNKYHKYGSGSPAAIEPSRAGWVSEEECARRIKLAVAQTVRDRWVTEEECARRVAHAIAQTVRELVDLAQRDCDPEWVRLVVDVADGKYGEKEGVQ